MPLKTYIQDLAKNMTYRIRSACSTDLSNILTLIHRKAVFDGCPNSVTATPEKLEKTLFCSQPLAHILLAETKDSSDPPVGFASYHFTYSTFLAQPCLWLDDIFVESDRRNQGMGARLVHRLCQIAQQHDCGRIDWTVNINNDAGIRFYQRMGAKLKTEVYLCRLDPKAVNQQSHSILSKTTFAQTS